MKNKFEKMADRVKRVTDKVSNHLKRKEIAGTLNELDIKALKYFKKSLDKMNKLVQPIKVKRSKK